MPRTEHTYRIRAVNAYAASKWSSQLIIETLPYTNGSGTMEDPFVIYSRHELEGIVYNLAAHYKLGSDIDLQDAEWIPLGTSGEPFSGSLDGNGNEISNLVVSRSKDYTGLFGYVTGSFIKDLEITNAQVSGRSYTGALAGYIGGSTYLDNCSVSGSGSVSGTSCVGGLVGKSAGEISNSSCTLDVTGSNVYVGGLTGWSGDIRQSYATGNVVGSYEVGGLTGRLSSSGIIDSYALGDVTATNNIYGRAGGLVGYGSQGTITNCYAAGCPEGKNDIGGLIGKSVRVTITSSYFNSATSGLTSPETQARTTNEMMQQATYTDWDFTDVWNIYEASTYPFHKKLYSPKGITAINITSSSVALTWDSIPNAGSYDIESNGIIVGNATSNTFTHENVLPGSKYTYRVRVTYQNVSSNWSEELSIITLIDTPVNINTVPSETSTTVSWDAIPGATYYEIEVDGEIINNGNDTTYIHGGLAPNSQHTYRIKAKNDITESEWSDVTDSINWPDNVAGVCLAAINWLDYNTGPGQVEVHVRVNNISNLYTAQFEIRYDPQLLVWYDASITNVVWQEFEDVYMAVETDEIEGRIKIMLSRTGNNTGESGQFDVLSLIFDMQSTDSAQVCLPFVRMVDDSGTNIETLDVPGLEIKLLNGN